ncbi:MAG: ATP-binding protein [Chloroflexota bacterium]|nr:ATP-binding protein [Chloroflexota bacterium]
MKRALREADDELVPRNLALGGVNEELLVANEEIQARTEVVETLNAELQATNEEVETLNEELQATNEELTTTNDDLQARSVELQELAASLEEQRRSSEDERARLEAILTGIADAVLVVDRERGRVLANEAYERIFGARESTLEDENGEALPPDGTPEWRAARGESFSMNFQLTAGDGTRRWFEARGGPIQDGDQDGGRAGVVVIRDISERSLRQLQEDFMALASHELRTPLTAVQGYLQLLTRRQEIRQNDVLAKYAQTALSETRRLAQLIDELTDVTRLQTGKLKLDVEPVDLDDLVSRVVDVAQSLTRQSILVTRTARVTVPGDAARLEQVVLNLVTNAIVHAPESERIELRLRESDGYAELQVRDWGPGIPGEDLPHLFSRLYQVARKGRRSKRGLGLGLFISKEIVAAHGGDIAVDSVEGEGAVFTVRLPATPKAGNGDAA